MTSPFSVNCSVAAEPQPPVRFITAEPQPPVQPLIAGRFAADNRKAGCCGWCRTVRLGARVDERNTVVDISGISAMRAYLHPASSAPAPAPASPAGGAEDMKTVIAASAQSLKAAQIAAESAGGLDVYA